VLVVLPRADAEGRVSFGSEGPRNHTQRDGGEIDAAAVHLHQDRRFGWRPVV
jgi:hypothetical protein